MEIAMPERIGNIYTMADRETGIDENVMMAYFKNIGAASARSQYPMLKSTLFVFQNVR
jgi:hypothetical protein